MECNNTQIATCELRCPFGLQRSPINFCRICQCLTDPCANVLCPHDRICANMFYGDFP
ncbi:hypothetical protein SNEBB_004688, partial [Seison nebaliae]